MIPSPELSILDAVFTVSPNKQYLGILIPITPATHGPLSKHKELSCQLNVNQLLIYINAYLLK